MKYSNIFTLSNLENYGTISLRKVKEQRRLTLFFGGANPPDVRKEGLPMITYQDLFLFCTFIVSLISLIYQILKGKK